MSKKGQEIWAKAKKIIPGGNMILSKRPEMFLPDQWPVYFSKAKGYNIWDLENNKYVDMSLMGVGTNILGYGHEEVDNAVIENIKNGNMSTLNCKEEFILAEKLIEINTPWGEMVKFARSGGEANAIAIRIARAASGKDQIAICGYHGWHDWYLSANLNNKDKLESHLLPNLETCGVPRGLANTVFPFSYNNFSELESIIENNDIGVVKMEVVRTQEPTDDFLQKIREITKKKNIILIFDECTSGFRETYGGISKKYQVQPDMTMFGKALGNGYGITAVIGKKEIMEHAQSSFISSTFWSERTGFTAGIKTLEVMQAMKSWEIITKNGKYIKDNWKKIADQYDLGIDIWGIDALPGFTIKSKNYLKYKTYISQTMLENKILASNAVYVSIVHDKKIIDEYLQILSEIFKTIKECEDGRNIDSLLKGPVCQSGFKRIN